MAVTITKPASGATLAGLVTVEATYSGQNFDTATVTVDGQQLASDSAKPIAFSIDTTRVPDGSHTLTVAVRYRTSGGARRWQKASIPITTEGNDMEVTISTNKDTSNLAGTVVVTATVTPPAQATTPVSCQFFVDNVLKATDTSYPLSFSWDTTTVVDGDHVLKATVIAKRTKTRTLPVKVKNTPIQPPPPPPIQAVPVVIDSPTISGSALEGQMLIIIKGTWTNSPTSYTHQWMRCDAAGANGVPIPAATGGNYSLTADDVGKTIRCWTTAFNTIGASSPILSAQTEVVSALAPSVPVLVIGSEPMIAGTATQGNTLTISSGGWTNSPTSHTHCWNRCDSAGANCIEIPGQNCGIDLNAVYVLTLADVGKTIKCYTTAYNATGASTPHLTAQTAVVAAAPAPPPPPPPTGGTPVWVSDFQEPWPGRNVVGIDSWAPFSGSTIDLQQNNNNFNFHIVSSPGLPQWGSTGEFKIRSTDKLADGRWAVLLQAENNVTHGTNLLFFEPGQDLYMATWFNMATDTASSWALLWELHDVSQVYNLSLPDNIAPQAIALRAGSGLGWAPRPGDGFVPASNSTIWFNYRHTAGNGSSSGWVAKHWAICPLVLGQFVKVIVRLRLSDTNGILQVWFDNTTGTGNGSFTQGSPVINFAGPTNKYASAHGVPTGPHLYGLSGIYNGVAAPGGTIHMYAGGLGRAHTSFSAAAAEFS